MIVLWHCGHVYSVSFVVSSLWLIRVPQRWQERILAADATSIINHYGRADAGAADRRLTAV
jgi:hypothetical protein